MNKNWQEKKKQINKGKEKHERIGNIILYVTSCLCLVTSSLAIAFTSAWRSENKRTYTNNQTTLVSSRKEAKNKQNTQENSFDWIPTSNISTESQEGNITLYAETSETYEDMVMLEFTRNTNTTSETQEFLIATSQDTTYQGIIYYAYGNVKLDNTNSSIWTYFDNNDYGNDWSDELSFDTTGDITTSLELYVDITMPIGVTQTVYCLYYGMSSDITTNNNNWYTLNINKSLLYDNLETVYSNYKSTHTHTNTEYDNNSNITNYNNYVANHTYTNSEYTSNGQTQYTNGYNEGLTEGQKINSVNYNQSQLSCYENQFYDSVANTSTVSCNKDTTYTKNGILQRFYTLNTTNTTINGVAYTSLKKVKTMAKNYECYTSSIYFQFPNYTTATIGDTTYTNLNNHTGLIGMNVLVNYTTQAPNAESISNNYITFNIYFNSTSIVNSCSYDYSGTHPSVTLIYDSVQENLNLEPYIISVSNRYVNLGYTEFTNYYTNNLEFYINYNKVSMGGYTFLEFNTSAVNNNYAQYYTSGYKTGYSNGYTNGVNDRNEYYSNGGEGYETIYNEGYSKGQTEEYSLVNEVSGVINAPFTWAKDMLNFEVLGLNLFTLFTGAITIIIFIALIKHFMK